LKEERRPIPIEFRIDTLPEDRDLPGGRGKNFPGGGYAAYMLEEEGTPFRIQIHEGDWSKKMAMSRSPKIIRHEAGHAILHKGIYKEDLDPGLTDTIGNVDAIQEEIDVAVWEYSRDSSINALRNRLKDLAFIIRFYRNYEDNEELESDIARMVRKSIRTVKARQRKFSR